MPLQPSKNNPLNYAFYVIAAIIFLISLVLEKNFQFLAAITSHKSMQN